MVKIAGPSAQRRVGILDGLLIKGFYFQLAQGTPLAQKLHAADGSEALFRPFGAARPDLFDLLAHRDGVQKSCFWGIAPKRYKFEDRSTLGGACNHSKLKAITFEIPFGIVFSSFL